MMRLAAFRGARPLALLFVFVTLMLGPLAMSQSVPGHKQDAGNNNMSPPGAILDLSGTPIPGGARSVYQQYSVNFTATLASTVITFGFRDDPSFISFSNASVIDLTSNSANLLVNGNFSAGIFTTNGNADAPTGWVYSNQFGATFGGKVDGDCGVGAGGDYGVGACWYDGAVQAYDALSQTIATTPGHVYQVSFWAAESSACETNVGPIVPCDFSSVSSNGDTTDTGGNGIDITVYATAAIPEGSGTYLGGGGSTTNPTGTIAEPINTATGNLFIEQTDLSVAGRGLPFVFNRYYNSLDNTAGPLGIGWTHTYNLSLTPYPISGFVTIRQQDGSVITFHATGSGTFSPVTAGITDSLKLNANGSYTLTRHDQRALTFTSGGLLQSLRDRDGNTQTLGYSAAGDLASITDTVGRTVRVAVDANHRIVSLADPIGRKVGYAYDAAGHLISSTDLDGNVTIYAYDAANRLSTVTDARGVQSMQNTYDAQGRVVAQKNGRGTATQLAYNSPSTGTTTITDGNGNILLQKYDANLRLIQVVDGTGAKTQYAYDANNNPTSVTDAKGNVTTYAYDAFGNVTSITDALGNVTSYTYDAMNDVLSSKNASGATTLLSYDGVGNLMGVTDALGNSTRFTRDAFGEITSLTDALGDKTQYSYDAQGNLIQVVDGAWRPTTFGYDGIGRQITQTDALGATSKAQYDNLDQLSMRTDPLGHQTIFTYDAIGDLTGMVDAKGNRTAYSYDPNGQLQSLTDAVGAVTTYAYDGNYNLVQVVNANGKATSFAYDAANRVTLKTDPLGRTQKATYDANGGLLDFTDGNGATSTQTYDALERLIGITYADLSTVSFSYDDTGNLIGVVDPAGTSNYAYDPLGRLTGQVRTPSTFVSNNIQYQYDAAGREVSVALGTGSTIRRTYDASGLLTSVSDWLGNATRYTYDAAGRTSMVAFPNGISTRYTRDADGQILKIESTHGMRRPIDSFTYGLDQLGNRVSVSSSSGSWLFSYDALSRVQSIEASSGGMISYKYDADGNRLSMGNASFTVNFAYDAADELTQVDKTSYSYDGNGNLSTRTTAFGRTTHYEWNAAQELASVLGPGGLTTSYLYDGLRQRVARSSYWGRREYLYDDSMSLPELLLETTIPQDEWGRHDLSADVYVFGRSVVEGLHQDSDGRFHDIDYIHQDVLDSTVAVTDPRGNIEQTYHYSLFGTLLSGWADDWRRLPGEVPFGFTGQITDPSDGLIYMRARYYDSARGRFISRDPSSPSLSDAFDRNPYVYARNNPATFRDPSGLAATSNPVSDPTSGGAPYAPCIIRIKHSVGATGADKEACRPIAPTPPTVPAPTPPPAPAAPVSTPISIPVPCGGRRCGPSMINELGPRGNDK